MFQDTNNAVKNYGNNVRLPQRENYYDVGVSQNVGSHLTLGLNTYYRQITNLQNDGQFGAAPIYAIFDYEYGHVSGSEFTASYNNGPSRLTSTSPTAKRWASTSSPASITSIPKNSPISTTTIYPEHDLFGTGLRRDGYSPPNGLAMPDYFQLNLSVSHDFDFAATGELHTQFALIGALDHMYELRDGSGIGVGAPQFGPRRGT